MTFDEIHVARISNPPIRGQLTSERVGDEAPLREYWLEFQRPLIDYHEFVSSICSFN